MYMRLLFDSGYGGEPELKGGAEARDLWVEGLRENYMKD